MHQSLYHNCLEALMYIQLDILMLPVSSGVLQTHLLVTFEAVLLSLWRNLLTLLVGTLKLLGDLSHKEKVTSKGSQ